MQEDEKLQLELMQNVLLTKKKFFPEKVDIPHACVPYQS